MITYKPNKTSWQLPERISRGDGFLVFLLIVFSGNPALYNQPKYDIMVGLFGVFLFLYLNIKKIKITPLFWKVALVFLGILVVQAVQFSIFEIRPILGFYTRLFIGFAIIHSVRNFPYILVRIMFWLAIFAMGFHYIRLAGFDIPSLLVPLEKLIGISLPDRQVAFVHTYFFNTIDKYRNSGMFWEPGAFAGYMILSLLFLGMLRNQIPRKQYIGSLILFSLAILSSKSTMGYLVLPIALLFNLDFTTTKDKIKKIVSGKILLILYIIIPAILASSLIMYEKVEFLENKVEKQLNAVRYRRGDWHLTRYGSLSLNLKMIKKHPFTGSGAGDEARHLRRVDKIARSSGMGNGMAGFIVNFGIIGFCCFLICVYSGFRKYGQTNIKSLIAVLLIVLTLQGEGFLNHSLYMGLFFLSDMNQGKSVLMNTNVV